jgi:hypothetical protein
MTPMRRSLLLLAALAAAPLPASAERPAAELHCIYDGADAADRARAGEKHFLRDDTPPSVANVLRPAASACMSRYGWDEAAFMIAARYTLSRLGSEYGRGWFAARGLAPERIDRVYEDTPREERLTSHSAILRDRMLAMLAAENADPLMEQVVTYVVMRRGLEQSELDWAALPAS